MVLLRVQPLVRERERMDDVRRLVGQVHRAVRARDVEPLAALGERVAASVDQQLARARVDRATTQNSSPPSRYASPRPWARPPASPRAAQQRVARRVTEAVVVGLEAVRSKMRGASAARAPRDDPLEVAQQPAPVSEAGQVVGHRLVPGQREELRVLTEREGESHEDEQQRRRREGDRKQVETVEVVDERIPIPMSAPAVGTARSGRPVTSTAPRPHRNPAGRRDQEGREWPQDVDRRPRLVARELEEVDRVCDRRRDDAGAEHQPGPLDPPARRVKTPKTAESSRTSPSGYARFVATAPGSRRSPAARPRRAARWRAPRPHRGGHAVEPQVPGDRARPPTHEEHDPDVEERVEGSQPKSAATGRPSADDDVVELCEAPRGERQRDDGPGEPVGRDRTARAAAIATERPNSPT